MIRALAVLLLITGCEGRVGKTGGYGPQGPGGEDGEDGEDGQDGEDGKDADAIDADRDGVTYKDDCDDADASVGAAGALHLDADGDGYGHPTVTVEHCSAVTGWVADGQDCDDQDAQVHPDAAEVCNGIDDDCDALVDDADNLAEGAATTALWSDEDGDGWGADGSSPVLGCGAFDGLASQAGDCDDVDPEVNPGAAERCADGVDNDCSGEANTCTIDAAVDAETGAAAILAGVGDDDAGWDVGSGGDLDGDGIDDLVIGAPGAGTTHAGAAYVAWGGFEDGALERGRHLRQVMPGIPILWLGAFPCDHPELACRDGVDLVIQGDPGDVVPDLLSRIDRSAGLQGTPGTASCVDGSATTAPGGQPRGEPGDDLDAQPSADLGIYERYGFVSAQRTAALAVGRGSFENLHAGFRIGVAELRRRFQPARRHSVAEGLARVHVARSRRPSTRRLGFRDDSFALDEGWLTTFVERLAREVELPFGCIARPDHLPPRVIDALAAAGCDTVRLGIESGDPGLRRQLAGTAIADEQIEAVVERLRGHGITVHTVSFLGVPGETIETALRTVDLLARLRPDHASCFPTWAGDSEAALSPQVERLALLAPLVARSPRLAARVRRAVEAPRDGLYRRLFQLQHDVGFLRSGELPAGDIARIVFGMRAGRAR